MRVESISKEHFCIDSTPVKMRQDEGRCIEMVTKIVREILHQMVLFFYLWNHRHRKFTEGREAHKGRKEGRKAPKGRKEKREAQ